MGVKLKREKPRNLLLSFLYKISRVLPLGSSRKFKLFLDLEWIFDRLSHEMSFKVYSQEDHPFRKFTKDFILKKISSEHTVLDLGCNHGFISHYVAQKAKKVVGIDYDEGPITEARNKYDLENLTFEVGEAYEYLEKQSDTFDVLILSHLLEHLDNPKDFLIKFKIYFNLIYIEVPDFDKYYLNHYRRDTKNKLIYSDDDHVSEFDRYELRELLAECNLEILDEEFRFGNQKIWCKVM